MKERKFNSNELECREDILDNEIRQRPHLKTKMGLFYFFFKNKTVLISNRYSLVWPEGTYSSQVI